MKNNPEKKIKTQEEQRAAARAIERAYYLRKERAEQQFLSTQATLDEVLHIWNGNRQGLVLDDEPLTEAIVLPAAFYEEKPKSIFGNPMFRS